MSSEPSFEAPPAGKGWVRADLHLHTAEDIYDAVDYTGMELLDMAEAAGIRVLAITLHKHLWHDEKIAAEAKRRGILLIPGVELRVEGGDVVYLNARPGEPERAETFEDLRKLRADRGRDVLTIVPHPFYIIGGSIGRRVEQVMDCIDAVEFCHFHMRWLNPNAPAVELARRFGKPMMATSDSHRRIAFGRHYTWVEAGEEPTVESVFTAIRENRVRLVSPACSTQDFLSILHFIFIGHQVRRWRKERLERELPRT